MRRWTPNEKHYKYIQALIELGVDAPVTKVSRKIGMDHKSILSWEKKEEFLRWRNQEIMRYLTADIPANTAFALRAWINNVVAKVREGIPPTNDEMDRLMKLADRFNVSLHVPEEVTRQVVVVNLITQAGATEGNGASIQTLEEAPLEIDFDRMGQGE